MLPDFPKLKERFQALAISEFRLRVNQGGLLGAIARRRLFEGCSLEVGDVTGYTERSVLETASVAVEVDRAAVIELGFDAYLDVLRSAVKVQQQQLSERLYAKIDQITTKQGNVIRSQGGPFSPTHFLEVIERVDMDFDEHGQPDKSSLRIVLSPTAAERVRELAPEWEQDPEFQKRYDEIIAQQRKRWNDRESNRKLVD